MGRDIPLGLHSPVVDRLAVILLVARIGQTVVHIAFPPNNAVTSLRLALFFSQAAHMVAVGTIIATSQGS